MENLILGFNADQLPVVLTDNTSPNDVCASFYFRRGGAYYLLWVEHQHVKCREQEDSPRYAISCAINEGDDASPEVYSDPLSDDVLQTDSVDELIAYFSG